MNNISKYLGWLLAGALGITVIVLLLMPHNHDHKTGTEHNHEHEDHDDHAHEAESAAIKEVELNQAQFDAAGIKTGPFYRKNL